MRMIELMPGLGIQSRGQHVHPAGTLHRSSTLTCTKTLSSSQILLPKWKSRGLLFLVFCLFMGFFSLFPCRNNDTFWKQDADRKSFHCSFLLYRFCSRKLWYESEFGVAGNSSLLKWSWDLKVNSCLRCKKHPEILQAEKHKVIFLDQIYGLWGCELKAADDSALQLQPD